MIYDTILGRYLIHVTDPVFQVEKDLAIVVVGLHKNKPWIIQQIISDDKIRNWQKMQRTSDLMEIGLHKN